MKDHDRKVVHSSESVEWATPQKFYDKLNEEFSFSLDAAATAENAKCAKFYTQEDNSLIQEWAPHTVFCNPPYTRRENIKWLEKGHEESLKGATVVFLLPSRTGSKWFHDVVIDNNHEVRYIRGRLRFGGSKTGAPFDSLVVVMRPPESK